MKVSEKFILAQQCSLAKSFETGSCIYLFKNPQLSRFNIKILHALIISSHTVCLMFHNLPTLKMLVGEETELVLELRDCSVSMKEYCWIDFCL